MFSGFSPCRPAPALCYSVLTNPTLCWRYLPLCHPTIRLYNAIYHSWNVIPYQKLNLRQLPMASYPKVRGACEYCHRRKIRCILPPESGSCHNCAATRTTCLFAPRAKAGRPRREHTQLQRQQTADAEVTELNESFETSEQQLETPKSIPLGIPTPVTTDDQWSFNDNGHSAGLQLQPQFLFPYNRSQWQEFSSSDDLSLSSSLDTHDTSTESRLPTSSVPSNIPTLSHSRATSHSRLTEDFDSSESPGHATLDFEVALKLCADLDHRCREVKESNSLFDVEEHLLVLDAVCMASVKTHPGSDSATRALTLAAFHRALEMCDTLVNARYYEVNGSETTKLQQLLLLRRLDTVVTFGRICFMRMGQATEMKTAQDIHDSIERRLKTEYGHWGW